MKSITKSDFSQRVLKLAHSIPKGRVTTYGRIARAAGSGGMAAQSITSILSKAEDLGTKSIPYHRIVYADGHIWVDESRRTARLKLYREEGIEIDKSDRVVNFRDLLFEFS